MNHDEELSDYLDGRLDAAGRARVEALLAADPALARRLRLYQAQREALRATASKAPADLKASLRAAAAESAERPTWRSLLREAFAPKPWAFGAASAFAAALVVMALRQEKPVVPAPMVEAPAPAESWAPAQAQLASELWADDDGGDHDEA